jgi:hypothetical protein
VFYPIICSVFVDVSSLGKSHPLLSKLRPDWRADDRSDLARYAFLVLRSRFASIFGDALAGSDCVLPYHMFRVH